MKAGEKREEPPAITEGFSTLSFWIRLYNSVIKGFNATGLVSLAKERLP